MGDQKKLEYKWCLCGLTQLQVPTSPLWALSIITREFCDPKILKPNWWNFNWQTKFCLSVSLTNRPAPKNVGSKCSAVSAVRSQAIEHSAVGQYSAQWWGSRVLSSRQQKMMEMGFSLSARQLTGLSTTHHCVSQLFNASRSGNGGRQDRKWCQSLLSCSMNWRLSTIVSSQSMKTGNFNISLSVRANVNSVSLALPGRSEFDSILFVLTNLDTGTRPPHL